MKKNNLHIVVALICVVIDLGAQNLKKADINVSVNYGVPHLYRTIVKAATQSDLFKSNFSGKIDVSNIKGLNPIAAKGEYGINEWFAIGFSAAMWNMSFDITDHYNIIHAGSVIGTDETDIYKFKITSTSIGVRPNIHIPFKDRSNDLFIGFGLGGTSNKLTIDFSSTDVNKVIPKFKYDLSLPGGLYLAPSIGYRHYFGENVGLNLEIGYEKGALVQAGLVIRVNAAKKQKIKQ